MPDHLSAGFFTKPLRTTGAPNFQVCRYGSLGSLGDCVTCALSFSLSGSCSPSSGGPDRRFFLLESVRERASRVSVVVEAWRFVTLGDAGGFEVGHRSRACSFHQSGGGPWARILRKREGMASSPRYGRQVSQCLLKCLWGENTAYSP